MSKWAVIFFILALVAAIFGFGGIAESMADIAKALFGLFLIVFVAILIISLVRDRAPPPVV